MKKLIYLVLPIFLMFVISCSGRHEQVEKKKSVLAEMDSVDAHGTQRMQSSKAEEKISFKGKEYLSYVYRTADDKLPTVKNDIGETYLDNTITVKITHGGTIVFNKIFTKRDFASLVDASFLASSVLEGIVFDKVTSQGIVYAASICYPQSDLYIPFSLLITADGKLSITKVDMFEETNSTE